MKISKNRLEGATQLHSPNVGALIKPRAVVVHYTAGSRPGPAVNTFMNERSRVSAHLVIDRLGSIWQLVDFTRAAWHAGASELPGVGVGCNRFSIGIELVNRGWSLEAPELGEQSDWELLGTRYWHRYPEVQLAALDGVLAALWAAYPLQVLTGHEHVAPGRKSDPGPLFPWARYSEQYAVYLDKP